MSIPARKLEAMLALALFLQASPFERADYDRAARLAKEKNTLLFVYVSKPGDAESARQDEALQNPEIQEALGAFVCLPVNALRDAHIVDKLKVRTVPSMHLIEPVDRVLRELDGVYAAAELAPILRRFSENFAKLQAARGKPVSRELFDIYFSLEDWTAASDVLGKLGEQDPAWTAARRIDLSLRRADMTALQAAAALAEQAGARDEAAAARAVLLLKKDPGAAVDAALAARKEFPKTSRDDILLMVAASGRLAQKKIKEAVSYLNELATRFPSSEFGRWAARALNP